MPNYGEIVFFDRSWYSRAMIQPTMGYCTKSQYEYFMKNVNDWEKNQIKKGVYLIKIYLSVDKDTQIKRFKVRRNHSLKYWKLSKNDIDSLSKWESYSYYKLIMFEKTSTELSPWTVINSNNKLTARLNAIRYVLEYIDYHNKINLKPKSWSIEENEKKIRISGVLFDNLSNEQYKLLNEVKQII